MLGDHKESTELAVWWSVFLLSLHTAAVKSTPMHHSQDGFPSRFKRSGLQKKVIQQYEERAYFQRSVKNSV